MLQDRKGLVKLAIRTGASIVPCYLFGNTKLYSMWYGGDDERAPLRRALRWLSRKIGACLSVCLTSDYQCGGSGASAAWCHGLPINRLFSCILSLALGAVGYW